MFAITWSKPIATKAMIGKKIARILPVTSSAASAIHTARQTSQLQPTRAQEDLPLGLLDALGVSDPAQSLERQVRGQHAGLDAEEVGDEQRAEQVAERATQVKLPIRSLTFDLAAA